MADRIVRNTQGPVDHTFLVGTTPTDPDGNTATVDITRGDGSVFATNAATVRQSTGVYRYTLAPQADLERFTMVFEGTFGGVAQQSTPQVVEVVGGFYASLSDIRALPGLSNTTTYPDSRLRETRAWFEDLAEDYCGTAYVPRYAYEVLDGDGTDTLLLGHTEVRRLLSVTVDGATVATTEFQTWPYGRLRYDSGVFTEDTRNVVVTYEYGFSAPDADLREAALIAIRDRTLGFASGIPTRAESVSQDGVSLQISVPGSDNPTGLPFVDEVLRRRRSRVPAIG
jgi:hypothetical protein